MTAAKFSELVEALEFSKHSDEIEINAYFYPDIGVISSFQVITQKTYPMT